MIIQHRLEVPYSQEEMFALVADYQSYPLFIKSCAQASTEQQSENQVLAELVMSFAGIKQAFSTYTTFFSPERITMELAEGPFKKLKGEWTFSKVDAANEQASAISLYMDYELSPLIEMLIGRKFQNSMEEMIACFIHRAAEIYGPR